MSTEGIFRVPGGTFASNAIFAALVHLRTGDEVLFAAEPNVHNLSAALKVRLRVCMSVALTALLA